MTWNEVVEIGGLLVGKKVRIEIDVEALLPAAPSPVFRRAAVSTARREPADRHATDAGDGPSP